MGISPFSNKAYIFQSSLLFRLTVLNTNLYFSEFEHYFLLILRIILTTVSFLFYPLNIFRKDKLVNRKI